jgi:hypothetical protein
MILFLLKRTLILIGILVLSSNCTDSGIDTDAPKCIDTKIKEIMMNDVTNPPTQVWKWVDDSNTYYYITSDCCDQYNYLYTINCEIVCAPDGGITGNGDGNCPEFTSEIKKTLIWEDKRN